MAGFNVIRARAIERKGGEGALASLLGEAPDNSALRSVTDDRVLSAMAERIFSAGFVWRVIRDKWPGFEEAFLGFQPKALLFQPDEFWHDLAGDRRIVRNPQKIKAVRENAAFVDAIAAEHGTFGAFLADWPAKNEAGLLAFLSKNGARLGGNTGQYFLRWIGWDGWVASGDVVRALKDAGVEIADKPTSKKDLDRIQAQMNAWHNETGLPYVHLSRILAYSIGDNHDPETIRQRQGGVDD